MSRPPRLEMLEIDKSYGSLRALKGVDLTVVAGEVHALVGENGAGKSTLLKVLGGEIRRDRGRISIDGEPADLSSPARAQRLGIGIIHQELNLVPALSVAENILLGAEPLRGRTPFLDRETMAARARAALDPFGEPIDPATPVDLLGPAHRQIVEIGRALSRRVRLLALDEPSASLTLRESERLFAAIRRLRSEGVGILYISHRLEEIFEIADRVTVLRDGQRVASAPIGEVDRSLLIRWMVGREMQEEFPRLDRERKGELLRIEELSGARVGPLDLSVDRGEVVGLAGLVGSGRSELARIVFGADRRSSGRILLEGEEVDPRSPRHAIDLGIALLTEDRNRLGLFANLAVRGNITLAGLARFCRGPFLRGDAEDRAARGCVQELRIRPPSLDLPVESLSGGNRQKVVLARWLLTDARLLIFDEPTAGVDVGARYEIYGMILNLAARGKGVLMISSDLPELLGLCDRIVVMAQGRITGGLGRAEASQERILDLATPTMRRGTA